MIFKVQELAYFCLKIKPSEDFSSYPHSYVTWKHRSCPKIFVCAWELKLKFGIQSQTGRKFQRELVLGLKELTAIYWNWLLKDSAANFNWLICANAAVPMRRTLWWRGQSLIWPVNKLYLPFKKIYATRLFKKEDWNLRDCCHNFISLRRCRC